MEINPPGVESDPSDTGGGAVVWSHCAVTVSRANIHGEVNFMLPEENTGLTIACLPDSKLT